MRRCQSGGTLRGSGGTLSLYIYGAVDAIFPDTPVDPYRPVRGDVLHVVR